jgi:hypothetical protein
LEPTSVSEFPLDYNASASETKSNDKAGDIPIERINGIKAQTTNFIKLIIFSKI